MTKTDAPSIEQIRTQLSYIVGLFSNGNFKR